jgi:hypothetical protein
VCGAGHHWFMPIILAAQEGEIMRIAVLNQPRKIVCKTLSQKNKITKESDFFFLLLEWLKV